MSSTRDGPPRALPSVPILSLASFRGPRRATLPSLIDDTPALLVSSGRIAIGLALRALAVGPGDVVLVPAYHSLSMIPPAHWLGARVVFYRVHLDTTADLDDIAAKLATEHVKAVIATHFFGFPQDLSGLRALCDRYRAGLVEDCAHCFFGRHGTVAVGSSGDYAIGSSMKFFPIYEGGCLVSRRRFLGALPVLPLRGAGTGFEAKAALNAIEASFAHGRLPALQMLLALPLQLKNMLWNRIKSHAAPAQDDAGLNAKSLAPSSSDSSFDFDPCWTDKRSSRFSQLVLRFAGRKRIVDLRRRNYVELARTLENVPGWRPLFPVLPDGACPWVFPLLAEQPEAFCALLRANGVPMVRFGATLWPGVDASVCANSVALGRQLIGLPCHQELSQAELSRLATHVKHALAGSMAVPA